MEKSTRLNTRKLVRGPQSSFRDSLFLDSPGLSPNYRRINRNSGTTRLPNRLRSLGPRYNSIIQNSLASLLIVIQNICVLCQLQDGSLLEFCDCTTKLFHEQCIYEQIKKNISKLKEQAFRCQICSNEYKLTGYWVRDINTQGRKTLICISFCATLFLSLIILIAQIYSTMTNILILLCCIIETFILIIIVYMIIKNMTNFRIIRYKLIPRIFFNPHEKQTILDIPRIMPYILSDRYEYIKENSIVNQQRENLSIMSMPLDQVIEDS